MMSSLLEKLKLKQHFTIELELEKNTFYTRFNDSVDESSLGLFSDYSDIFSSSKNQYKGHVGYDDFKIRRKNKLFNMKMNMAVAKGFYHMKGDRLIIQTTVNSFSGKMIPFYLFAIAIYGIMFGAMVFTDFSSDDSILGFALPFLILHALFMFGIPYFIMRKSTSSMLYELEREFFYLTK